MQVQAGQVTVRHYRYNKARKLGKGATGSVYLGTRVGYIGIDTRTGQQVAIKVINMKDVNNEVKRYLLMTEQVALTSLKHPNIIRCMDVIQQPTEFYFITQYCPDGTLHEFIKHRGQVPEQEALNIFRGIVSGCALMVQNGMTHRDLKPSNILMDNGVPKITDFGFCDIAGKQKPRMFYNVGSPSYMSPEAYMDNIYGEKSEVWAIGCILYEMLVGSTIDTGRKITDLYKYLKAGREFIPNGISPLSKTILTECLRYDPRKRITVKAVERMLDSALGPMQPPVFQSKATLLQHSPSIQAAHQQPILPGVLGMEPQFSGVHPPPTIGTLINTPPPTALTPALTQPLTPALLPANTLVGAPGLTPALTPSVIAQEIQRQHSRRVTQQTTLQPPGTDLAQQRLLTSLGNPPLATPFGAQVLQHISRSKSPLETNISRAMKGSYPMPESSIMKGSIVDEDSWLARDLRQKEMFREAKSSIQNSQIPMVQSIQQPSPPQIPFAPYMQTPQVPLAPLRAPEMPRPFAPNNRAPELHPMKMTTGPMPPPPRGMGTTRMMNAPPPIFYR